jgi:DNA-binding GntR family transcriptional regulator
MAARLAAASLPDAERRELRTVFEHEVAAARSRGFRSDFHMRIVQGSHNEQLARMLGEDHYHLHKFWRVNHRWLKVGGDASWQDHRRILEAIEFRDAECAEILMRRHVARLRLDSLEEIARLGIDLDEPGA